MLGRNAERIIRSITAALSIIEPGLRSTAQAIIVATKSTKTTQRPSVHVWRNEGPTSSSRLEKSSDALFTTIAVKKVTKPIISDNPQTAAGSLIVNRGLTTELTHAGPEDAVREAELSAPSGVVCSDFVRHIHNYQFTFLGRSPPKVTDATRLGSSTVKGTRQLLASSPSSV